MSLDIRHRYVTLTDHGWYREWACEAGQPIAPVGCERHAEHYWCETCRGYFGVPHDAIHEGEGAHPTSYSRATCACRPCKESRGAS